MRIVVIGTDTGTSRQRMAALRRLGHDVVVIDPYDFVGRSRLTSLWLFHTGGIGSSLLTNGRILRRAEALTPDLIWVDHGGFLGPRLIFSLRKLGKPVVNYMIDNAWSSLYRSRSRLYRAALRHYDLAVVMRGSDARSALAAGARGVLRVNQTADEVDHAPRDFPPSVRQAFASEVAFVGSWFPDRGPFLAELAARGVPLAIWGERWHKAPEWKKLRPYWRGRGLYNPDDYAAAIQCAKINLGLLARIVGDLRTSRTYEIPALGGVFCAERTVEHLALYEEGEEAVFWDDAEECAAVCLALLDDEPRRRRIAQRGRERALRNGNYNEPMMKKILEQAIVVHGQEVARER